MEQRYAVTQSRDAASSLNSWGVPTLLIGLTCAVCRQLLFAGPCSDSKAHTHSIYGEITRLIAITQPVWVFTGTEHVTVVFPLAAAAVAALPKGHVATAAACVPCRAATQHLVAVQPRYRSQWCRQTAELQLSAAQTYCTRNPSSTQSTSTQIARCITL
jgi:hypothetical protein